MISLFDKKKNAENEETKESDKGARSRKAVTPEAQMLRQKEFVWTEYDTNSKKKSADWYFVLWTIAVAGAVAAVLVENV